MFCLSIPVPQVPTPSVLAISVHVSLASIFDLFTASASAHVPCSSAPLVPFSTPLYATPYLPTQLFRRPCSRHSWHLRHTLLEPLAPILLQTARVQPEAIRKTFNHQANPPAIPMTTQKRRSAIKRSTVKAKASSKLIVRPSKRPMVDLNST